MKYQVKYASQFLSFKGQGTLPQGSTPLEIALTLAGDSNEVSIQITPIKEAK